MTSRKREGLTRAKAGFDRDCQLSIPAGCGEITHPWGLFWTVPVSQHLLGVDFRHPTKTQVRTAAISFYYDFWSTLGQSKLHGTGERGAARARQHPRLRP